MTTIGTGFWVREIFWLEAGCKCLYLQSSLLSSMTRGYWYPQPKDAAGLNKMEGVRTVSYSSSLSFGDGLLWWLRIRLQCGRPGFDPWVGKIPWRRAWQPTPVFLPGESPWTEESIGLHSMGPQRVWHNWATNHTHTHHLDNNYISYLLTLSRFFKKQY